MSWFSVYFQTLNMTTGYSMFHVKNITFMNCSTGFLKQLIQLNVVIYIRSNVK